MVFVAAFSHVTSCCVLSQGWAERRKFVALRPGPFVLWTMGSCAFLCLWNGVATEVCSHPKSQGHAAGEPQSWLWLASGHGRTRSSLKVLGTKIGQGQEMTRGSWKRRSPWQDNQNGPIQFKDAIRWPGPHWVLKSWNAEATDRCS